MKLMTLFKRPHADPPNRRYVSPPAPANCAGGDDGCPDSADEYERVQGDDGRGSVARRADQSVDVCADGARRACEDGRAL